MTAQYDPAATAGTLTPNTAQGKAEVIADARLDAASATAWYLAANPNMADTIEVAFLDGDRNPRLEQQQEWTRDGTSFKVAIDACAAALGYQGLYKNAGA